MSHDTLQVPASISSTEDLTALIHELHGYRSWFHQLVIRKRAGVKTSGAVPPLSPAAKELVQSLGSSVSETRIDSLIQELTQYQKTAPVMTITLAAAPTDQVKASLVGWCRQEITAHVLVNFHFSESLLGGMVVQCGSHIFDWSFRRQLFDGKAHFPEVLRHV